jgi:hypothetical protein
MFIASIRILAKHNIPAVPDILMFARATLLYDTLAARLDPTINFYKEHERFAQKESKKAKKRARRAIPASAGRPARRGLRDLEQAFTIGNDLLFRVSLLSLPYDFAILPFLVEKRIFAAMMVIRFAVRASVVTALGVGVALGLAALNEQPSRWRPC